MYCPDVDVKNCPAAMGVCESKIGHTVFYGLKYYHKQYCCFSFQFLLKVTMVTSGGLNGWNIREGSGVKKHVACSNTVRGHPFCDLIISGSRGRKARVLPLFQNLFIYMQFLGKIVK